MKFGQITISLVWTILLLLALDFFSTTISLAFGIQHFHFAFEVLIILYLGFRFDFWVLPIIIVILMFFHSAFSTDGWQLGTTAGILICMILGVLRDLIHISSKVSTMIVVQLAQIGWFVVIATIISMKIDDFSLLQSRFLSFIPESILMSLIAPYFFVLLERIWDRNYSDGTQN